MAERATTSIYHVRFSGLERGLDHMDQLQYLHPRQIGRFALWLNRDKAPDLKLVPELPPISVEEVINLNLDACVARVNYFTDRSDMTQDQVLALNDLAAELLETLSPSDQQEARRQIRELTGVNPRQEVRDNG
jgi:hypothetical protein